MSEIAKDTSDKIAPSTDGQMKDITGVLVTAMPDHETFDREKMEYWGANKKLLKAKIQRLLQDVPQRNDFPQVLKSWEKFYREVLKTKVDFSDIDLPPYASILCCNEIIPVVAEITTQEILDLLKANFPVPICVTDEFPHIPEFKSLAHIVADANMAGCVRRPSGHYGILHRGSRFPDLDMGIAILSERDCQAYRGDAAFVVRRDDFSRSFPEEFMSPKEYLLFVAYQVWCRFPAGIPWYDASWEEGLYGTAFPFMPKDGFSDPNFGCRYFPAKLQLERVDSGRQLYGRRVRVLPSLRKA